MISESRSGLMEDNKTEKGELGFEIEKIQLGQQQSSCLACATKEKRRGRKKNTNKRLRLQIETSAGRRSMGMFKGECDE